MTGPDARAQTLLRAYPRSWRERYGDEFAALLADDIAERPRCLRRDVDVLRCALTARFTAGAGVGLTAVIVFAAAATSIWTQLVNGTLDNRADSSAVTLGLVTLSLCGAAVAAVALAGAGALLAAVVRTIRAGAGRRLLRPLAMTAAGAATFIVGALHVSSHAAPAATHSGVLAGAARWTWAATESISTYWIHPYRLLALPLPEVAWMLASPIAAIVCWRGVIGLAARTELSWPARYPRRLAMAVLVPALVAAATWVIGSQHDPHASLRAGTLDLALIAAMTVAVLTIEQRSRNSAHG